MDLADPKDISNIQVMLKIVRRSVLLVGTTLTAYILLASNIVFTTAPFYQFVYKTLLIVLLTRWGKHFAGIYFTELGWLPNQQIARIVSACNVVRVVAIVYVGIEWLYRPDMTILFLLRFMLAIYLFIWLVKFWKLPWNDLTPKQQDSRTKALIGLPLVSGWS